MITDPKPASRITGSQPITGLNVIVTSSTMKSGMERRSVVLFSTLLLATVAQTGLEAGSADNVSSRFFGTTNLWSAELVVSRDQWTELLDGGRLARRNLARGHETEQPYFYAHADFKWSDHVIHNVGIRLKGGGTQGGNRIHRWPFRLSLNHFGRQERLDGASKISLNNNYYDSSYLRDALSYEFFRDFDVPAPRTCFIKLHSRSSIWVSTLRPKRWTRLFSRNITVTVRGCF
jgi:CotH kinase protein